MDDNLFFKQATLLICSSLEIETALWRCRQFISQCLPADRLYLNIYEPSIGGLRYIAAADRSGCKKMAKTIPLPGDLIQAIESGRRLQDYLVINRPDRDPIGRIITTRLNLPPEFLYRPAALYRRTAAGGHRPVADGRNRYTEAHARRFALLREPFAVAMANALKHQEVVELKEKLVSTTATCTANSCRAQETRSSVLIPVSRG
jgi:hypothetical protein